MSNLIDNAYTQLNNLTQINADDIQTESINTKALYINNVLFDPSGTDISDLVTLTTAQNISNKTFTGTTIFSSIQLNDSLIVNSGGTTILNSNLALINFLSGTSSNINTRFNDYVLTTTLNTKLNDYVLTTVLNTKLNDYVLITALTTTLNNYVSTTALNTKLNDYVLTTALTTTLNNYVLTTALNTTLANYVLTTALNTTLANYVLTTALNTKLNDYVLTTALNTTLANYVLTTALNTKLNDYVLTTALNTTLNNYALSSTVSSILTDKIGTMTYYLPSDFNIFNNICSLGKIEYENDAGAKIDIIPIIVSSQDKLINVTRTTEYNYFDINSNVHIFNNLILGNILNVESLINAAMTEATAGLTAALIADGLAVGAAGVAATANTTANGAASGLADLTTVVEDHTDNLIGLNYKTSQISYSDATNRTTISQTLYSPLFEITTLASGFNQTSTDQITLAGKLRCNNRVEVNNTLELVNDNNIILEGVINQDNATPPNNGVNQFLAPTTISGNATLSGLSTTISSGSVQIGVNSVSILNVNSTTSFGGDVSLTATKNLRLKNIVPILFDDIVFGDVAINSTDDAIFNMQMVANRPVTINNTLQHGTSLNRYSSTAYNTTSFTDADVSINLTSPIINLSGTRVNIGQLLGTNYLYGTTYVQKLYSVSGVVDAVGQVFQQW